MEVDNIKEKGLGAKTYQEGDEFTANEVSKEGQRQGTGKAIHDCSCTSLCM
jgi:hypothetical protein